jgi:alpha-L-rhamnosidase
VGFNHILIHPNVAKDLTRADTTYESVRGEVACRWQAESGKIQMDVTIPPNTQADIYVPTSDAESVMESGSVAAKSPGIEVLPAQAGCAVFRILGGIYRFEAKCN